MTENSATTTKTVATKDHPILQEVITIANYDGSGIFTLQDGTQYAIQRKAGNANKISYLQVDVLRKVCSLLGAKNQQGKACRNLSECIWALKYAHDHPDTYNDKTGGTVISI